MSARGIRDDVASALETQPDFTEMSLQGYCPKRELPPTLQTVDEIETTTISSVSLQQRKGAVGFFRSILSTVIPHGGLISSSFNLASASLGAGILTLPWGFRSAGVVMGTIYLILMTIFTVYTVSIIGIVIEKTGYRAYEQMSKGVLGNGAEYFIAAVMGVSCIGAAVAYVIATGTLITPLLHRRESVPEFLRSDFGIHLVTASVWLFGMLPLVLPKQVNTLRYFSAIGVFFVLYFVVLVVVHSCQEGLPKRSEVNMVTKGNIALEGLGVFVFSYLCHAVAYPVYTEMESHGVKKLAFCTTISMTICSIFYWMVGFFGYMEFGEDVQDSVLFMYDPVKMPAMLVAYAGLIVKLCVSYALNMIPCRNTVYFLFGWDINSLPYWKHMTTVSIISLLVLLCGIFIQKISLVFGLAGAVCGGVIGFIYPALFYMYSGNWTLGKVGWFHYTMTYLSLIAGVVSIVFGTGAIVYATVV